MQTISEARLALDSSSSSESNPIPREKRGKKKWKKIPQRRGGEKSSKTEITTCKNTNGAVTI